MSDFWPFVVGGVAIGAIAAAHPFLTGRALGVSSSYASVFDRKRTTGGDLSELEAQLLAATEAAFGVNPEPAGPPTFGDRLARLRAEADPFRPLFLLGLPLGASLAAVISRDFAWLSTLGKSFDERYGELGPSSVLVLLLSGLLIGVGTRVAGGCTSGHGISGVARGEKGSLLTTCVFWSTALAVGWALSFAGNR